MTTILLARHGESDWNAERRWQGQADRPLTERGRIQATELADRLDGRPLTAVYSSDLRRALDTASVVASRHGLPVEARVDLREVDCGSWTGQLHDRLDPDEVERWRRGETPWTGGESYEEMRARMVSALLEVAEANPAGDLLVVSHGSAIRSALASAAGLSLAEHRLQRPPLSNTEIAMVVVENGSLRPADAA